MVVHHSDTEAQRKELHSMPRRLWGSWFSFWVRWKRRALARRQSTERRLGFSPGTGGSAVGATVSPSWSRRRNAGERREGIRVPWGRQRFPQPDPEEMKRRSSHPTPVERAFRPASMGPFGPWSPVGAAPGGVVPTALGISGRRLRRGPEGPRYPDFPARRKACSTRNPQPKPSRNEKRCQIPTINPSPMTAHPRRSTSVAKRLSKPTISCNLLEPQTPAPFPRIDLPLRQTHHQRRLPQCQAPSHSVGISARTECSAAVRRCTSATIATSTCGCAASRCAWPAPSPSASPIASTCLRWTTCRGCRRRSTR